MHLHIQQNSTNSVVYLSFCKHERINVKINKYTYIIIDCETYISVQVRILLQILTLVFRNTTFVNRKVRQNFSDCKNDAQYFQCRYWNLKILIFYSCGWQRLDFRRGEWWDSDLGLSFTSFSHYSQIV